MQKQKTFHLLSITISISFFLSTPLFANTNFADFHGFFTAFLSKNSGNREIDGLETHTNFLNNSLAGFVLRRPLTSEWDTAMMLVARGSDGSNFNPKLEWAVANWTPTSNFALRFGKQLVPVWLSSDHIYVSALYPWSRPPTELYDLSPFSSFIGLTSEFKVHLSSQWRFENQLFFGGTNADVNIDKSSKLQFRRDANLLGTTLSLKSDQFQLRASYVQTQIYGDLVTTSDTAAPPQRVTIITPFNLGFSRFASVGTRLDHNRFLLMSEWGWEGTASNTYKKASAAYVTSGVYSNNRQWLMHLTHGRHFERSSTLFKAKQLSFDLGLNYQPTTFVVYKANWKHVITHGGNPTLEATNIQANLFSISANLYF